MVAISNQKAVVAVAVEEEEQEEENNKESDAALSAVGLGVGRPVDFLIGLGR